MERKTGRKGGVKELGNKERGRGKERERVEVSNDEEEL